MTEVNTGGWIDVYEPNNATEYYPDRVYYAVERVGASLAHDRLLPGKHSAQGNTRDTEYERPAAAWAARCRAAPIEAFAPLRLCSAARMSGLLVSRSEGSPAGIFDVTIPSGSVVALSSWVARSGESGSPSRSASALRSCAASRV